MSEPSPPFALRRLDAQGTLIVTGPDRASWLNGLLTCDVVRCRVGEAVWGLALDRKGKIQSVVWVVATPDALLLGVSPGTQAQLLEQFERMLVMEDAEVVAAAVPHHWALSLGPTAPPGVGLGEGTVEADFGSFLPGARLWIFREGGEPPWLAGATALDDAAWTLLRLQHGLGEFGTDFGPQERPHEAGLDRRAVNWSKGCYLGQEVVCMQDQRGKVKRRLTALRALAPADAGLARGTEVLGADGEAAIGTLRSVAYSESEGTWRGLAMLPTAALSGPLRLRGATGVHSAELG